MTDGSRSGLRVTLAAVLVVLSPMCAEYVTGYDDSTGDPVALAGGLLIFSPLYGAPALLIRETARRLDIRWPGVLALAAAFGVLQAGVVDQSLFAENYRDISYWEEMLRPTYIEPLGLGAYTALSFVAGHAIWSFGVPIALTEGLSPRMSRRPWLRAPGLPAAALLYVAAAALVLSDHLRTEPDHATPGQLAGALAAVALLVAFAFTVGRHRPVPRDRAVPRPVVVAAAALVAGLVFNFLPSSWAGVAAGVALPAACGVVVGRLARSPRWTGRHVAALASGALAARAVVGFFAVPLGEVAPVAKYTHNVAFFAGALLLGVLTTSSRKTADPAPEDRRGIVR